jgi:hypothetical protein
MAPSASPWSSIAGRSPAIADKLERYELIASAPDAPDVILFCFATPDREQSVRPVLRHPGMLVATSTLDRHGAAPLGPVWRIVGEDRRAPIGNLEGARDE